METSEFAKLFQVADGSQFRLKDFDAAHTLGLKSKKHAQKKLEQGIIRLAELQEKLYAQDRWAILMILQGMDAAGKASTVKRVMSGVNPQWCQVNSYKPPSAEELNHDFLWRSFRSLSERGKIGIFNRSYYEEVLVVQVLPEQLASEIIPAWLCTDEIWRKRFEDINSFERYLSRNGIVVLKFFLQLPKKEQNKRLLEHLAAPEKNWKFSMSDAVQRQHREKYMRPYEDIIRNTSTNTRPSTSFRPTTNGSCAWS